MKHFYWQIKVNRKDGPLVDTSIKDPIDVEAPKNRRVEAQAGEGGPPMTGPEDPAFMWEFKCEMFVFARIAEEQEAAAALPPGEQGRALALWSGIAFAAAEHTIYVELKQDADGGTRVQSRGRCYTCHPAHGVPCATMCRLARIWAHHPDYVPAWNEGLENVRGLMTTGTWDVVASGGFWPIRLREREAAMADEA